MPTYQRPGVVVRRVANPLLMWLTRRGMSVWGSRVLEVRGRKTGEPVRLPVNLLELDGRSYLVSPRGHTQWVRNARADDGRVTTILGSERTDWTARELSRAEAVPVLRAYLKRWKLEVGAFFDGVSDSSTDAELEAAAADHPAFELTPR